jgi:hypothetical protein
MRRKNARRKKSAGREPRRPRWPVFVILLLIAGGIIRAVGPSPGDRGWRSLGKDAGRIRWVETRTDGSTEAPLAPGWIRDLNTRGIPWPSDLPLAPLPASFGSNPAVAWYVIRSARPSRELWHLDKESVHLTDASGNEVPWEGATGAVLIDSERRLQYLHVGVPRELSGTGARLRLRVSRFEGPVSREVRLPF